MTIASWLRQAADIVEALERLPQLVAALEAKSTTPAREPAGGTVSMSDKTCERKGCTNKLTAQQVKWGGRYCSRSCSTRAARPWLTRKGIDGGKNSTVSIVAGEGVRKGHV